MLRRAPAAARDWSICLAIVSASSLVLSSPGFSPDKLYMR